MPSIPKPDAATLAALAAAGYPDPGPPSQDGDKEEKPKTPAELLAEAFPGIIGGAAAGVAVAQGMADAAQTKSGISQYLIAGGGAQQSDSAGMTAVVSALNRLAGFKSRL